MQYFQINMSRGRTAVFVICEFDAQKRTKRAKFIQIITLHKSLSSNGALSFLLNSNKAYCCCLGQFKMTAVSKLPRLLTMNLIRQALSNSNAKIFYPRLGDNIRLTESQLSQISLNNMIHPYTFVRWTLEISFT